MRILIAPQELKGTLTASQVARGLESAVKEVWPDALLDVAPLADGGPGLVDAFLDGLGGERNVAHVSDALGKTVRAHWGRVDQGRTAVIEMAAASGLTGLAGRTLEPDKATSFGTGELIRHALDAGCERLIVGLGGSATNDAGAGAMSALGVRFLDAENIPLPPGGLALQRLARIDTSGLDPRLATCEVWAAADVTNPLVGPLGASRVYGPQKGAGPDLVEALEGSLAHCAKVVHAQLGKDFAHVPRVGAAGGLGYGLAVFLNAKLLSGFELVRDRLHISERLMNADIVLTGEGRLDEQTLFGKGPGELAQNARAAGKPCVAFVGQAAPTLDFSTSPFAEVRVITPPNMPFEIARQNAGSLLTQSARAWALETRRRFQPG